VKVELMKRELLPIASLLLLLTLFTSAYCHSHVSFQRGSMSRSEALRKLKECAKRLDHDGCSEDTAQYVIGFYERGDHTVLQPLFTSGLTSDGALSEMLGTFFGELLWKDPVSFLHALSTRPRREQPKLSFLAGSTDGSGMPSDWLTDVRRSLRKISSARVPLSSVARICLREVNRANSLK
jgi:hypothetical protein